MKNINRRDFIKSSAEAAAVGSLGFHIKTRAGSPNDTIRVGVVGVKGQGDSHLGEYGKMENVEVAAICDVDESFLKQRCAEVEKRSNKRPTEYVDIRKLLEDKSIDVISIATPNHWHSLIGIWACQAGKDVYVEKPCSHNISEGRRLVEAARKHERVVQHGTQCRSSQGLKEAIQQLRSGV